MKALGTRNSIQHSNKSLLDYWMVLKAFILIMVIKVLLQWVPLTRILEVTKRTSAKQSPVLSKYSDVYMLRVVRAVRAVARRFLGDKPCLPQALAVQYFLSRSGKESELQIGVIKKSDAKLDAHAWLEVDGEVVIGGRKMSKSFVQLQSINTEKNKSTHTPSS